MGLDRVVAEEQAFGDLAVGQALGDQPEDFDLTLVQAVRRVGRSSSRRRGGEQRGVHARVEHGQPAGRGSQRPRDVGTVGRIVR